MNPPINCCFTFPCMYNEESLIFAFGISVSVVELGTFQEPQCDASSLKVKENPLASAAFSVYLLLVLCG